MMEPFRKKRKTCTEPDRTRLFSATVRCAAALFVIALGLAACGRPAENVMVRLLGEARYPQTVQRGGSASGPGENANLPGQPETALPEDRGDAAARGLFYTDGTRPETDDEYEARLAREEAERLEREAEEARRLAEEERKAAEERARLAAEEAARLAKEEAIRAKTPGWNDDFVKTLTKEEQEQAQALREEGFVFYRQNWSVLKDIPFGPDGFGQCGCGPTCTAEIIANLAGVPVTPAELGEQALDSHSVLENGATSYDFIIRSAAAYGISSYQLTLSDKKEMLAALNAGSLVLVVMGPGDFTLGSHFVLYRGLTEDGKLLISDSYSYDFTVKEWDYDDLCAQSLRGYWVFEKPGKTE